MSQFSEDIKKFNSMYKFPVSTAPTLDVGVPLLDRLIAFKSIVSEELNEIDAIIAAVEADGNKIQSEMMNTTKLGVMVALTDLLGDIQVYCASEMAKFGLPLDETLKIIMQSNFSKMGADGNPIYDERGKLQKGPNYWKPEPKLAEMLASKFETNSINKEI